MFFIKQPSSQKKDPLTFPDANHKISFGFIKNLIKDPISTLPKRLLPSENKLRIKKIDLKGVRKRQFFKPLANKHQNSQKKINLLKINYTNNKTKILNICKKFEPQLESQIKEMKIYNVYLGKTSDYKKALEWLKAKFNNLNFVKNLSYGVYNDQINQSYVCFNSRLRDELPEKLLLVYFDEGTRKNTNNCYSLDALKSLGNGAKNMYIFWQDENHTKEQNFWQENFYTDLIYEKGSGYHSPSYLNINSIVLKKKDNNEVVAIFPIKCQIKAPISLYNYDLELRFPYYKYQYKGLFWKTRKIKRIQKIDLYAKQTGEKRTLYYEDKF
ncbi:hypothetical protein [Candidatus Phytoplasma solani]|uniref:hypothetical protein n=1 Tax=Candidatus Phytoplasma solani TaxID=69896 RepID=UPI0032D9C750